MPDDRKTVFTLIKELEDAIKTIPGRIEIADDDGPLIKMICEDLRQAIKAVNSTF